VWPPEGAIAVPLDGFYDGPATSGYGPAFRGLRKAWRCGQDIYAEVGLSEDAVAEAGAFGLHPALLDAAFQAAGLAAVTGPPGGRAEDQDALRMPFAFAGVSLHAAGASALRVRLSQAVGGALSLTAADTTGTPVISVDSLVTRPVSAGQLAALRGGSQDTLFTVQWLPVPVPALPGGGITAGRCAVAGADPLELAAGLAAATARTPAWLTW
jgi:hypothetical protein